MRDFRNVEAWHKAHKFTMQVFRITEAFPKTETFGLSMLLRRGAANIPMKIAEGCGQDENAAYFHCLQQARALATECEYLLLLGRDLHFMEVAAYDALQDQLIEVRKMVSGLMKTLRAQPV